MKLAGGTMKTTWSALTLLLLCSISAAADLGYDREADPFDQYHQAIDQAAATNKLVLIVAGGDWCRWCHVLNRFVASNEDVEARLNDTFVVMKVYVGPGNFNELFFSQLPEAYGAPHFWTVSPQREVLASQSTAKLERGNSTYDKESFLAFIEQWKKVSASPERHARTPQEGMPRNF
jgi:Thioredoxin-like